MESEWYEINLLVCMKDIILSWGGWLCFFFLLAMDGVEVCDFNYKILTMAQLEAGIGIRG